MLLKLALSVLVLSALVHTGACGSDSFTSTDKLVYTFKVFSKITHMLLAFRKEKEPNSPLFSEFVSQYEDVNAINKTDQKRFLSNPVNAFLFIRLLTDDLENRLPMLTLHSKELQEKLKKLDRPLLEDQPTMDDYEGALSAINRLIDAYLYPIEDVMIGKFNETSRSLYPLDTVDCYQLAKNALRNRDFHLTYAWANQSLKLLENENSNPFIKRRQVYHLLSELALRQKNPHSAYMFLKQISIENPDDAAAAKQVDDFIEGLKKYNTTVDEGMGVPLITQRQTDEIEPTILKYEALCRDDKTVLKPVKPLSCRYLNDHPFLVIGPVKEEKIYDDPPMWIYYDTLTEKQAKYLKKIGLPKLRRALVGSADKPSFASFRITQSYFFDEEEIEGDETIDYLDYLVEAVTKLSIEEAEAWQIANYGVGGQYEPHFDYGVNASIHKTSGDRFATWLNYLEAPDVGGDTVFVNLGIKTRAVSRSSVLWYNLGRDLSGDQRTLHAACPVVLGSKWINNKWIHQNDQMFTKPCTLD